MVNRNIDERIEHQEVIIKEKMHLALAKQKYADIKVPQGINVDNPKYSQQSNKIKVPFSKVVSIPVITIAFLLVFISLSSTLQTYVSRVPLFEAIVKLITVDKINKQDILQKINQSVEDKGIKVTINNITLDKKKMIIDYTLETDEEYEKVDFPRVEVKGINGEDLVKGSIYTSELNTNDTKKNVKAGKLDFTFWNDDIIIPDEIMIKFVNFKEAEAQDANSKIIEGNWSFNIKLQESILKLEPKVVNINKEITLDNLKFKVKELKMYPSITELIIVSEETSNYKIVDFKNLRIVDNEGGVYKKVSTSGAVVKDQYRLHFESIYFDQVNNLSIEADAVYYMPKEEQFIQIDLKNKKIIDSEDYKLEFDSAASESYNNIYKNDKEYLSIGFKVTDEEFYNNLKKDPSASRLYLQFSEAYDENNTKYDVSFGSSVSLEQTIFASIRKPENVTEKLKLKVSESYKDMTAPFKVRLK
jgi:hypothetical protein